MVGLRSAAGPGKASAPSAVRLSDDDCFALDDRVIRRLRELGMILHRVGHGWTAFAVGLPGYDWSKTKRRPAAGKQDWLALVGGKRALWQDKPVNTELCYSRPDVRRAFVDEVVTYARSHSEVDALHVWMSDSLNNKCECPACRRKSPSDWYATLVEAVGRRLKAEGLRTRVVFLAYVDMLVPPRRARIAADNVILMFAPITRCFRHALSDPACRETFNLSRPRLNRCALPKTNAAHAHFARLWKKLRLPDTFLFDYHMMWATWRDGFGLDLGATMARDMKDLGSLGLNGFVSCQCVRAFYPLPYLANAMADHLWNARLSPTAHRGKILGAAFGGHAREVEAYFSNMVRLSRRGPSYRHDAVHFSLRRADSARFGKILAFAQGSRRRFAALAAREKSAVVRTSLRILALHVDQAA